MVKKELTPDQEKLMYQVKEEYLKHFFSLEFNEEKAYELAKFIYKLAGLEEPLMFVCESPPEAQAKANIVKKYANTFADVNEALFEKHIKDIDIKTMEYFPVGWSGDCSELGWVSFYDFFERIGVIDHKLFKEYRDLLLAAGTFMCIQFKGLCFIVKPPKKIYVDEEMVLHSNAERCIVFEDPYELTPNKGIGFHTLHGIILTESEFKQYVLGKPSFSEILAIDNVEKRSAVLREKMRELADDPSFKKEMKLVSEDVELSLPSIVKSERLHNFMVKEEMINADRIEDNPCKNMTLLAKQEFVHELMGNMEKLEEIVGNLKQYEQPRKLYKFNYEGTEIRVIVMKDRTHTDKPYASMVPETCNTPLEAITWMNKGNKPKDFVYTS